MTLLGLFNRCLSANYIHTTEDGDYAVERYGDVIYIMFQWSNGKRDWQNNFNFPAKPYRRMNELWFCHRGFLRVWKSMRDDIEAEVAQIITKKPEISCINCIGYSHGAALAVLASEDMSFIYKDRFRIRGFGFGCPRVLWGYVPAAVKNRLGSFMVIRNVPDIVTHVPPAIFGYRHIGSILEIGIGQNYTPVEAHYPQAYIDSILRMN